MPYRQSPLNGYEGPTLSRPRSRPLPRLARRRPIEFWALYNVADLGRAELGVPDESLLRVRHIPWTPDLHPGSAVSPQFYQQFRPHFVLDPVDPSRAEQQIVAFLTQKQHTQQTNTALLALTTLAVALLLFSSDS